MQESEPVSGSRFVTGGTAWLTGCTGSSEQANTHTRTHFTCLSVAGHLCCVCTAIQNEFLMIPCGRIMVLRSTLCYVVLLIRATTVAGTCKV